MQEFRFFFFFFCSKNKILRPFRSPSAHPVLGCSHYTAGSCKTQPALKRPPNIPQTCEGGKYPSEVMGAGSHSVPRSASYECNHTRIKAKDLIGSGLHSPSLMYAHTNMQRVKTRHFIHLHLLFFQHDNQFIVRSGCHTEKKVEDISAGYRESITNV